MIESIQEIDQALNTPGEAFQHKKGRTALEGQKYELALNTLLVSLNPAARQRLMFQVVDNDIKDSKGNQLTLYTVTTFLRDIREALDAKNIAHAVAIAFRNNLIQ